MFERGQRNRADSEINKFNVLIERTENLLHETHDQVGRENRARLALVSATQKRALVTVLGLSVAGLLIALTASFAMVRSVIQPINALEKAADQFGHGDFTAQAPVSEDELGRLGNTMNSMAQEIKEREVYLKASRDRFRVITDTAVDAIVAIDSNGKITFWNPAAERIFDYRSDRAIGRDLTFLMPERFREAHREAIARRIAGGPSKNVGKTIEVVAVRNGGGVKPISS